MSTEKLYTMAPLVEYLKDTIVATPLEAKHKLVIFLNKHPEFEPFIRYMYEPNVTFQIKADATMVDNMLSQYPDCNADLADFGDMLEALSSRYITGKKMKQKVWDYAYRVNPYIVLWFYGKLGNGVGISTIRELGIIPTHNPQKGVLIKPEDLNSIKYPIIADIKYNGIRLTTYNYDHGVSFKLLRGQDKDIPELEYLISLLPKGFCYDGELVYGVGITEQERIKVSGTTNKAGAIILGEGFKFVIYDKIPIENFKIASRYSTPFWERRGSLLEDINRILSNHTPKEGTATIAAPQSYTAQSPDDILQLMQHIKAHNGEGLMLKPLEGTYDFKKNKQWLKMKNYNEVSLRIIDYKPYTRDNSLIGSLLLEGTLFGEALSVWCGSGLNDDDRELDFDTQLKGNIVEVVYMDTVHNKASDTMSLSNPRFNKPSAQDSILNIIRYDCDTNNY